MLNIALQEISFFLMWAKDLVLYSVRRLLILNPHVFNFIILKYNDFRFIFPFLTIMLYNNYSLFNLFIKIIFRFFEFILFIVIVNQLNVLLQLGYF